MDLKLTITQSETFNLEIAPTRLTNPNKKSPHVQVRAVHVLE